MKHKSALGIGLAIAATLFYGQVPVFAKAAYNAGIPVIESILLRTYAVAIVFAAVALVRGETFRLAREAVVPFILQCLATLFVSTCYLLSVQFIPVNLAVIIFFAFPILVLISAPLIERHRPSLLRILIAILAFIGIAVAIGPSFQALDGRGLILAALAAVGCALQFFSGRALSAHQSTIALSSLVHAVVLPVIFLIALVLGNGHLNTLQSPSVSVVGFAFMIGVAFAYLAGYFLHMSSLAAAPASKVVPFFNLEPVVATIMATLVLHEKLAVNHIVGGVIVFAALILCGIIEFGSRKA